MNLHLVNDEKIINRTISIFDEVFPGQNLFVVTRTREPFKWVTKKDNVLSRSEFYMNHRKYSFDRIYIHSLNTRKVNILNFINTGKAKVYWIIWGFDLYNDMLFPKGFEIIDKSIEFYARKGFMSKISNFFDLCERKRKARRFANFVSKKVDCIVTDTTENDFDYLLKYYPQMKGKEWKDFFYYPLDVILPPGLKNASVNGNGIIIGNSASFTNNHEYAMKFLSKLNLGDRKVYVPLSYAGKRKYLDYVNDRGQKLLGDNFTPLRKFMPLSEYNQLLQSVSVAIYGNWRQEAIGNIIVLLYLGAKVFLPARNPVYEWALAHGLRVFNLENITQEEIDTRLPEKDVMENRKILSELYNKERMVNLIRKL